MASNLVQALYVVATPIGNLQDITLRALDVLKQVDTIAAEDTRHSRVLLQHYGINTPLIALHNHNEREKSEALLQRIHDGQAIALISDAGTPLISDPGYYLVQQARAKDIRVVPIPGASALIAALSVAGLPTDKFSFEGFLPAKEIACEQHVNGLKDETRTLIFYEAPHRILTTIKILARVLGHNRQAVIARELTKSYETIYSAALKELSVWLENDANQQRGELVLLVAGAKPSATNELDVKVQHITKILLCELPLKQAVKLASEITGTKKNLIYEWALNEK